MLSWWDDYFMCTLPRKERRDPCSLLRRKRLTLGVNFLGGCTVCIIFILNKFYNSEVTGPFQNVGKKTSWPMKWDIWHICMYLPLTMKQISLHMLRACDIWSYLWPVFAVDKNYIAITFIKKLKLVNGTWIMPHSSF